MFNDTDAANAVPAAVAGAAASTAVTFFSNSVNGGSHPPRPLASGRVEGSTDLQSFLVSKH